MRASTGLAAVALLWTAAPPGSAQRSDTLALSLPDAVQLALSASDEARLAGAQVDATGAQLAVARSAAFPQLRFTGSYLHYVENARGSAIGSSFSQPNSYNANVVVSQTVFEGGKVFAGWRAASRLRDASLADREETRAQLVLAVQRAYLGLLYTDRVVGIRERNYDLATTRLTQIQQLQTAGRAARYDVLRTRVERANLEPEITQARSDRQVAELELRRILNVAVERPLRLTTSFDAQSVNALLASLPSDTLTGEDRWSIRSARLNAEARHEAVTFARGDLFPNISVFFQYGYQAFPLGNFFPTNGGQTFPVPAPCPDYAPSSAQCTRTTQNGGWFRDMIVGGTITWSLFDGLRTKGNIDLARAQAQIADLQLAQQRELVSLEIARARAELDRARELFSARRENTTEAEESFRLASLRFTRGMSTQLEVSDAQLALLTAQSDQARSVFDLYLAAADLARAEGRPIPFPPSARPPSRSTSVGGVAGENSAP
jgi:outer membrane protein TolC